LSIFSVSEITKYIKNVFENNATLAAVFVRGEISNFKRHYSGHCYLTLKDNESTIKAVMFKSRAQFLKFVPSDGLKVIAGGHITVFERDGQYQLYIEQLLPEGIGELSLAFKQLKDKLAAEGLFAEERKKKLPLLPKTVGIVTSPTGAALRDIVTVSKRRYPGVQLILYPVQVQGAEAPMQIANAVTVFNTMQQIDVIIVGRGGGSIEELWAFNDEAVVRAIADSIIPVVSAVGHQTDYTLADFAADVRAATPSQAAEMVVPDVRELHRYILSLQTFLETTIRNATQNKRSRVEQCLDNRVFRQPQNILDAKRQLIDGYIQQLEQSLNRNIMNRQNQFQLLAEKLAVLNPLAVLARGYSVVRRPGGHVISKINNIAIDQHLEIILQDGTVDVRVIRVKEEYDGGEDFRK